MNRHPDLTGRLVTRLADEAERVWYCEVFHSGFHNGCRCRPTEPHDGWNCRWVWKSVIDAAPPSATKIEKALHTAATVAYENLKRELAQLENQRTDIENREAELTEDIDDKKREIETLRKTWGFEA